MADKDTKNVRALQQFRLKGEVVSEGEVVAKSRFANKQDWQNLLHMPKPRIEETNDPVGKAGKAEKPTKGVKADAPAMPGA